MSDAAVPDFRRVLVTPPYRFDMGLRRGESRFFQNGVDAPRILVERSFWLRSAPELYAAVLPEGEDLVSDAVEFAASLNPELVREPGLWNGSPAERCLRLGALWEPDFLLLKPQEGDFRLLAGCVCFPSSWSLPEKMGRSLGWIHGVVPQLNGELGAKIHSFLGSLRPGVDWERVNWGIAASPELNLHPARGLARLDSEASLETSWFRIEYQALRSLPKSGAVLFGLRIRVDRLAAVCSAPGVASTLRELLTTMPDEMAEYKGLARARNSLVRELTRFARA